MKLESIAGRRKSVSENCHSVEGAREERTSSPQPSGRVKNSRADEKTASSPQPSPPPASSLLRRGKAERERISETRSKQERKLNDLKFKNVTGQSQRAERRTPALRGSILQDRADLEICAPQFPWRFSLKKFQQSFNKSAHLAKKSCHK